MQDNKMLVGPYIKASDIAEAIKIADMYALTVVGEIHELSHQLPIEGETEHKWLRKKTQDSQEQE